MSSGPPKTVLVFNYHRVGAETAGDPFSMLHTVSLGALRRQVRLLARLGPFVSLDQIRDGRGLGRLSFAITFDDVSGTILSAATFLRERSIPFAICPCTELTDRGFGVRDKVYWVVRLLPEQELREAVRKAAGQEVVAGGKGFSFYRFTKRPDLDADWLETEIIDPLLAGIQGAERRMAEAGAYLNWRDIRRSFCGQSDGLVTIVNHGWRHRPMDRFTEEQVAEDVERSAERFRQELGMEPAWYAVPFGRASASLAARLAAALRPRGYRGILWVGRSGYAAGGEGTGLIHIPRIQAPRGLWRLLRRLPSYVKRRAASALDAVAAESAE